MRPSRFIVVASSLLLLLHAYIGVRLLPDLPLGPEGRGLGVLALTLSCVLMPLGLMARGIERQPLADRLAWAGLLLMGVFSSLLVLTLLRDIVLGIAALALPAAELPPLVRDSALAVPLLAGLVSLVGLVNARRRARVVEVEVPLAGLPPALDGFTIAQISDIHVGPTIKRGYLEAIVTAVNGLEADMVAVTGDLVDGSVEQLAPHTAPLSRLTARHGAYFVTGNHEYYSGAAAWVEELRRLGLRVLENEHVVLCHGEAELVVAGVTDYGAHHFDPAQRSDPHAALEGAPEAAGARILLAHQPRSAPAAAAAGFDLQLSGHTHGGQFWPWNLFVRLQQPYTAGLHRLDALWVYTSRGTGYWGPPKRFGAPSEITLVRLVAAREASR
ncbi:metallophosphoesterase [Pseudogulbenkiania ferrooxidans]|uniref:Metallophosphoesterase n=1 Tax=Pseudogulbenkiania ferrooxidans 2002 TaxID=279714 RepID=B9Z4J2_9NEIS|nr:metallophosphoesterase [Pseudogulbenkiania ferrooxidans]EEG08074.1 metallophosphoesterase [Pseudogulbenkiania ferrooxidans 2002]